MRETANTSVLVIDDEEMVRDNIEEILVPRKVSAESESVDLAASILFDSRQSLCWHPVPVIFPILRYTKQPMEWMGLNS